MSEAKKGSRTFGGCTIDQRIVSVLVDSFFIFSFGIVIDNSFAAADKVNHLSPMFVHAGDRMSAKYET